MGFGKFFCLVIGVLASLAGLVILSMPASAESMSLSGKITITGIVPPAKYVYIDSAENITKIISNSPSDAEPVFITDTAPPQAVQSTPQLVAKYEALKAVGDFNRLGTVYDSSVSQITAIGIQENLSLLAVNPSASIIITDQPAGNLLTLAD